MRLVTDLHDAIAAIAGNSTICSERLDSGRFCPRMAVGAVVIRAHSEPRCPDHLPAGAAKVCRGCSQLNASSDAWYCGACRDGDASDASISPENLLRDRAGEPHPRSNPSPPGGRS